MAYGPERPGVPPIVFGTGLIISALVGNTISGQGVDAEIEVTRTPSVEATNQLGSLATAECEVSTTSTCVMDLSSADTELIHARRARQGRRSGRASRGVPRYAGSQNWPVIPPECDQWRQYTELYPWPHDVAMLMIFTESGCDPNKRSRTNDYGLVQLHNENITDPATNIRRGFEKWEAGRVGSQNFSAFYAVCTPRTEPKYHNVACR